MFVDVIHTDGGVLGFPSRVGHADFFPNGGKSLQPGCDLMSIFVRSSFEDLSELKGFSVRCPWELIVMITSKGKNNSFCWRAKCTDITLQLTAFILKN
jgi:hypothetical protein